MSLWLESTTQAHPFIPADYWQESAELVRRRYLPEAQTWIWLQEGAVAGFISVLEARFIGALFVHHACQRCGIGAALMGHVQDRFPLLSLEVYRRNRTAWAFYRRCGFAAVSEHIDQETRHAVLIMQWPAATES